MSIASLKALINIIVVIENIILVFRNCICLPRIGSEKFERRLGHPLEESSIRHLP